MTSRVRRHEAVLRVLAKAKPRLVREIIRPAKRDLIDTICECALNVTHGNLPISAAHKKKLKRYVRAMRYLSKKKIGPLRKRKEIIQTGGFVGALLAAIIPSLLTTAVSALGKAITSRRK